MVDNKGFVDEELKEVLFKDAMQNADREKIRVEFSHLSEEDFNMQVFILCKSLSNHYLHLPAKYDRRHTGNCPAAQSIQENRAVIVETTEKQNEKSTLPPIIEDPAQSTSGTVDEAQTVSQEDWEKF